MSNGVNTSYFALPGESGNINFYFSIFVEIEAEHALNYTISSILIAMSVFVLVESMLFMVSFLAVKQLRNVTNLFVLSNTSVAVILLPFSLFVFDAAVHGQWKSGVASCKYAPFALLLSAFVLVWINAAIAVDRHRQITSPSKPQLRPVSATVVVVSIWIVGIILFCPYLIVYDVRAVQVGTKQYQICTRQASPLSTVLTAFTIANVFLVPLMVIIVSYVRICREIWKTGNQLQRFKQVCEATPPTLDRASSAQQTPARTVHLQQQTRRHKRYKRLVTILLAIVLLFIVMWLPLCLVFAAVTIDTILETYRLKSYQILSSVCGMLLNAFITPIFYSVADGNVRKILLKYCFHTRSQSENTVATYT